MRKYIDAIKEYSKNEYKKITRESVGELKYPFIVPGCAYQNQLWDWDSWLTDIAITQIHKDNSVDEKEYIEYEKGCILNFLDAAKEDGRIPILVSCVAEDNEKFWREESNFHKPCLIQHLAFIVKKTNGDCSWFGNEFEKLEKFILYYMNNCRHEKTGLYFWIDDFAIGFDNDPTAFNRQRCSSANIYLNSLMCKELESFIYICKCMGKDYAAYQKEYENLKNAMREHLWDEKCGYYFSADLSFVPDDPDEWLHKGNPRRYECIIERIDTWTGMMAMWCGVATDEQTKRIVRENFKNEKTLCSPYGIRSLSKLEKMYYISNAEGNPSCWTGPVWGIANYMSFMGLLRYGYEKEAVEIAEKTIKLFGEDILKNGQMHEYYHPDTGEGVNNIGFQSWNLLANNMIAYLEDRERIEEF